MNADEIKKLEAYLKRTLNPAIMLKARPKAKDSVEVYVGEEFIGTCYRDAEDGSVSYDLNITVLAEDLD